VAGAGPAAARGVAVLRLAAAARGVAVLWLAAEAWMQAVHPDMGCRQGMAAAQGKVHGRQGLHRGTGLGPAAGGAAAARAGSCTSQSAEPADMAVMARRPAGTHCHRVGLVLPM
jgi:hypothetical protein